MINWSALTGRAIIRSAPCCRASRRPNCRYESTRQHAQRKSRRSIAATFERGREEAAWQLYQKLRQTVPSSLSLHDRRELARMAESEGLTHRVHLIAEHAVEQFPESQAAQEWLAELTNQAPKDKAPSPAVPVIALGENGLLYLEVSLAQ